MVAFKVAMYLHPFLPSLTLTLTLKYLYVNLAFRAIYPPLGYRAHTLAAQQSCTKLHPTRK